MNRKIQSFALLVLISFVIVYQAFAGGSTLYPWPTDFSFTGLASWSQPLFASGTSLPSDGDARTGEIFVNLATAGQPSLWRKGASSWEQMSGTSSGGGDGVATHSLLEGLDFASAGHTGFASTGSLLDFAASSTVSNHLADQTDPHGASMSVSTSIAVGSGTEDAYVARGGTGTVDIASYARIVPFTATPTGDLATGTLWYDQNLNKLRCWDGSAWNGLW